MSGSFINSEILSKCNGSGILIVFTSAVALAGCSLSSKYLRVLLGVRALRQQGSEEVLGAEGRGQRAHCTCL